MEWKSGEEFEAFYTLWWRRQATLKTPFNQERAKTKQDATPTDYTPPHQEDEATTLTQHTRRKNHKSKPTYIIWHPNTKQHCNRMHRHESRVSATTPRKPSNFPYR